MNIKKTERGFSIIEFPDVYDQACSLQKSSLATSDCIWLGVTKATPMIMARDVLGDSATGWIEYPLPENVHIPARMHLNQEQVKALLPHLIKFAETGEL